MKTLKKYCAEIGSQEKAAAKIGLTLANLNRILNGHQKPHQILINRLKQLGVRWEALPERRKEQKNS